MTYRNLIIEALKRSGLTNTDTPRSNAFYANPPENEEGYQFACELERENAKLREALQTIVRGGYAPGADNAHPAIALARDTLDPQWRQRAESHYPKL